MPAIQIVGTPLTVDCDDNFKHHDHLWISPQGTAYIVESCGHAAWCRLYTVGKNGDESGNGFFLVDDLEKAGWVHLSCRTAYCYESRISGRAFDTLLEWCKIRERSFSSTVYNLDGRNW